MGLVQYIIEALIAGLSHHTLREHIIGDGSSYLGRRRGIGQQGTHSLREFLVEDFAIASVVILMQVALLLHDLIDETAEEFDMLGLFPEERRQKHLFLQATFVSNDHDQGQEVNGNALLTCLEAGNQASEFFFDLFGKLLPITLILGEVDATRVPGAELFGLVIKTHRQNVVTEATATGGDKFLMGRCHGVGSPFLYLFVSKMEWSLH